MRPLLVHDDGAPTATVIALVDTTAERTFLTDSGAVLRISPADWSPSLLDGVAHLHVSGYLFFAEVSRRLALLAVESARARGVSVSVDPASAGFIKEVGVTGLLSACSKAWIVLVPNADEARLLTGLADPVEAAALLSRPVPLGAVTLGARRVRWWPSGTVTAHVPAPAARAVDSTGAGDAFTGCVPGIAAGRGGHRDSGCRGLPGRRGGGGRWGAAGGRPRSPPIPPQAG